jgi:predicted amidophosphoribosyltransferase
LENGLNQAPTIQITVTNLDAHLASGFFIDPDSHRHLCPRCKQEFISCTNINCHRTNFYLKSDSPLCPPCFHNVANQPPHVGTSKRPWHLRKKKRTNGGFNG